MVATDIVSIIVRTTDGRFSFLKRAIFSIYSNSYKKKEIIIVYQGLDLEYYKLLCSYFEDIYCDINFIYLVNATSNDERSKNLNLGILASTGRYICFLDDDDIIYPDHIELLVRRLSESNSVWAFSSCRVEIENKNGYVYTRKNDYVNKKFSFRKIYESNFIPIHSFIVDIGKIVDKSIFMFDEKLSRFEDYDIILKLSFNYEPAVLNKITCSYKIRNDNSNTNLFVSKGGNKKSLQWAEAEKLINEKRNLLLSSNYIAKEYILSLSDSGSVDKVKIFRILKLAKYRSFFVIADSKFRFDDLFNNGNCLFRRKFKVFGKNLFFVVSRGKIIPNF